MTAWQQDSDTRQCDQRKQQCTFTDNNLQGSRRQLHVQVLTVLCDAFQKHEGASLCSAAPA